MARPSGLDDIRAQKATSAIASGYSRACAAAMAGVDVRTLHRWMSSNGQFRQRVKEADAKAEAKVVDALMLLVQDPIKPHFEAIRFWLKTRRAKTWREMQAMQPPEKPGEDVTKMSEDELWAKVDKLRAKRTG